MNSGHTRKVFSLPEDLCEFGSAASCEWDQIMEGWQNLKKLQVKIHQSRQWRWNPKDRVSVRL